jgi:hypothetical protein
MAAAGDAQRFCLHGTSRLNYFRPARLGEINPKSFLEAIYRSKIAGLGHGQLAINYTCQNQG